MENETKNNTVAEEQQENTQPEDNGTQSEKTFNQDEVNKIVSERLARERAKSEAIYADIEARENAIADREKEFADKEKALADREHRLFAIRAIKDVGLDDGSNTAFDLVDFVVAGTDVTEESITAKVKALKSYVDKNVASEVDKIFKANGRTPNGASSAADTNDNTRAIREAFGLVHY